MPLKFITVEQWKKSIKEKYSELVHCKFYFTSLINQFSKKFAPCTRTLTTVCFKGNTVLLNRATAEL